MKSSIAIITARGGSKRIPRKNIKSFCGSPIIAYAIKAAISSSEFDDVLVSTDDAEIATISKSLGASVPFMRTAKASDDFATTSDALKEVLSSYEEKYKHLPTWACCIYPTAPFLDSGLLKQAMSLLKEDKETLSVLPIVKFSFPIQRALRLQDSRVRFFWPENSNVRSQDLETAYHDAGQFYCFNVKSFFAKGCLLDATSKGIEVSELRTQDIDNDSDWALAELKWKLLFERPNLI